MVPALAQDLAAEIERNLGARLVSVVLYGSQARGDARPGSDVDLLIVADGLPAARRARAGALRAAAPDTFARKASGAYGPAELSLVVKSPEEASYHSPLYLDMTLHAALLRDRDGFFARILEAMRARMAALGSRRVTLPGGAEYWDLKPDYQTGEVVEI